MSKQSITVRSALGGIGADIILEQGSLDRVETQGDFTGSLTIENGNLNQIIRITGSGDLLGNIRVENGIINKIWVQGDIGTPTKPVTIFAGKDVSQLPANDAGRITIWYLLCRGDMYADITASDGASKEGQFKRIRANEGADEDGEIPVGLSDIPRDFTGTIEAYTAIEIVNSSPFEQIPCIMFDDVLGSSTIQFFDEPKSPVTINSLSTDSKILFGDGLAVVARPLVPMIGFEEDSMLFIGDTDGLKGQVIVNQGDGTGTWLGEFGIGNALGDPTIEIKPTGGDDTAPFYTTLPATLGGGAIGLAPFNFHNKGSLLVDLGVSSVQFDVNSTVTVSNPNDKEIVIEHYGPVFATGTPLEIHKHVSGPLGTETSWENSGVDNDVTSSWDQSVSSTEVLSERTATISPVNDTWVSGWYRAKPAGATGLKSAFVTDTPNAEYHSGHGSAALDDYFYFRVLVLSFFDLNGNESVDAPDAVLWVNNPVDFNNDSSADTVDFQMLINNME